MCVYDSIGLITHSARSNVQSRTNTRKSIRAMSQGYFSQIVSCGQEIDMGEREREMVEDSRVASYHVHESTVLVSSRYSRDSATNGYLASSRRGSRSFVVWSCRHIVDHVVVVVGGAFLFFVVMTPSPVAHFFFLMRPQDPQGRKVGIVEILHGSFGRSGGNGGTPFFTQQGDIVGVATVRTMKCLQDMPHIFGLMSLTTWKVHVHPSSRRRLIIHGARRPTTTS
jgi:hypothetical protein